MDSYLQNVLYFAVPISFLVFEEPLTGQGQKRLIPSVFMDSGHISE